MSSSCDRRALASPLTHFQRSCGAVDTPAAVYVCAHLWVMGRGEKLSWTLVSVFSTWHSSSVGGLCDGGEKTVPSSGVGMMGMGMLLISTQQVSTVRGLRLGRIDPLHRTTGRPSLLCPCRAAGGEEGRHH
jgi:hypothetical protein